MRYAARCLEARDHPNDYNRVETIVGYILEAQLIDGIRALATRKE